MDFIWDELKDELNKKKHDISFAFAARVFDDPYLLSWMDERFDDYEEERWVSL